VVCGFTRQERKGFFFEKKKQKTFICLAPRKLNEQHVRLRWRRSKRFLLLFSKKKAFLSEQ